MTLIPVQPAKGPTIKLTLMELAVLLYNLVKAEREFEHPNVGFLDFYKRFDQVFSADKNIVEDALYIVNLSNDLGKYEHPFKRPLKQLVLDIETRNKVKFNKNYNTFEGERK